MRLLLIVAGLVTAQPCFAATVDDVLSTVERLAAQGRPDEVLTKHLRALEGKLGFTLPVDPSAIRTGTPKPGSPPDYAVSDLGPHRPYLMAGTLAVTGLVQLGAVGGSLVIVRGDADVVFAVDSIVIATGNVRLANIDNSLVIAGGQVTVSGVDGSAVLGQRVKVSSAYQRHSKGRCILGGSVGVRLAWLGSSCELINTPAHWVLRVKEGATLKPKTDASVSTAKPMETPKTVLAAAPACRAALAQGAKPGEVSVGVVSVPWRAQRGVVPADLENTRVLEVYDGAIALERGGVVSLVKASPPEPNTPALTQPELLELGGTFELHGIAFGEGASLEPTKVRVAGKNPIVLVLFSAAEERWQVTVESGATLRAVVLLGGSGQQLRFAGPNAPVVLGVSDWPCGQSSGLWWDPLEGQQKDPEVLAKVLALLGRRPPLEFTSVQVGRKVVGGSRGEPSYVVGAPPKALRSRATNAQSPSW